MEEKSDSGVEKLKAEKSAAKLVRSISSSPSLSDFCAFFFFFFNSQDYVRTRFTYLPVKANVHEINSTEMTLVLSIEII